MATFKVKLVNREGGKREVAYKYVTASDDQAGYQKAAKRAEAKLATEQRLGFRAVAVNCVG